MFIVDTLLVLDDEPYGSEIGLGLRELPGIGRGSRDVQPEEYAIKPNGHGQADV